jgi:DNA-binding transcriptional LysR family regulator
MDLRQLRYFMQVIESGSITQAAQALNIVQPSLSLQIKNLEEELGVSLFVRHVRGVSATDQGRILYDYATRILREVERAKKVLKTSATSPTGAISIGIPTSACRNLAIDILLAARDKYPNLTINVVEAMTGTLESLIFSGKLDVYSESCRSRI